MIEERFGPAQKEIEMERWPSGLRRTLGKRVYGKLYRGFESLPLRQAGLQPLVECRLFGRRNASDSTTTVADE